VRLLRRLGGYSEQVLALVREHHERLDGSGYPDGVAGDAISLDARILGVCDVYDALISKRVYREEWSHQRALALLRENAGTQFDSRCVEALARVLERERVEDLGAVSAASGGARRLTVATGGASAA
jgi:HD-GYP domain-containing protein (c-di-GMP phosphodiesterase class II)